MVCKACGTKSRGAFCPQCGQPLGQEASAATEAANTAVVASASAGQTALVLADTDKTERRPREKVRIKLRQVFFPSLVFFLPLAYFFVDVFVRYSSVLQGEIGGASVLSLLITHLSDATFASNPVSDVIAAVVGSNEPLIETLTIRGILATPDAYQALIAPVVILAVSALVSALCGVLILLTAGRILRWRLVADLAVGGGFIASVSPLLANIAFRIYYMANGGLAAADAAADHFGFSVEVLLICGISLAMMIPAVRAIRRAAGGNYTYVTAPYRLLGRKFIVIRFLGLITAVAAVLLAFATAVVEVSENGTLLEVCFDAIENISSYPAIIQGIFNGGSILDAVPLLFELFLLPVLPLMLLFTVPALWSILRLFFARATKVAVKKRRRKALRKTGRALRRAPITLLAFYIAFQLVAMLLLLLATSMKAHIDLSTISETLTLFYLLLAFVKTQGSLYTIGILLAALSILFATITGNLARAFVSLSQDTYYAE